MVKRYQKELEDVQSVRGWGGRGSGGEEGGEERGETDSVWY